MAYSNIYLLTFNNYNNRQLKKYTAVSDYLVDEYWDSESRVLNCNFNPNDGVNTTHVVPSNMEGKYDYLIETDSENTQVLSRWFIIEGKRNRTGQYTLTLRRDVIAESLDVILNLPFKAEKGFINNKEDSAIFQPEPITVNQIKQGEVKLHDKTGTGWIVGYVPRDFAGGAISASITGKSFATADITVDDITNWEYYAYVDSNVKSIFDCYYKIRMKTFVELLYGNSYYTTEYRFNHTNKGALASYKEIDGTPIAGGYSVDKAVGGWWTTTNHNVSILRNMFWLKSFTDANTKLATELSASGSSAVSDALATLNGKTIYDSTTHKLYQIVVTDETDAVFANVNLPANSDASAELDAIMDKNIYVADAGFFPITGVIKSDSYSVDVKYRNVYLALRDISEKIEVTLPNTTTRVHLTDAPYDMFCIPYSDDTTILNNGVTLIRRTSKVAGMAIAQAISTELGSNNIYDIQIVPYCPARDIIRYHTAHNPIKSRYFLDIKYADQANQITTEGTEKPVSVVIWCSKSVMSFDIEPQGYNITTTNRFGILEHKPISGFSSVVTMKNTPLEVKISNQVDFVRLASPNYNTFKDLNVQKNFGITKFTVDIAYKPYNPYIHVSPVWNGLYGVNSTPTDPKGLICGGDYSLSQVTSAWADYELQNKYYQQIFDRGTEHIELSNQMARIGEGVGAVTGSIQGTAVGVIAGGQLGGPIGAGVGGAIGALAGIGGGIADVAINEQLRAEGLDYRRDLFDLNLQTIQAIPQGLSKVTALSPNNKIFPILEIYSCSQEERTMIENVIKWNGMTINRITTLSECIAEDENYETYVKGQLLRYVGTFDGSQTYDSEDYHYIAELQNELNKGVYIYGRYTK